MDDQSLGDLFAQFGQVESARIITDGNSVHSKGCACVEMAPDADAATAIEKLNGTDQNGRTINVSEAKPMAPREGGGGRGNSRGGFGNRSRY